MSETYCVNIYWRWTYNKKFELLNCIRIDMINMYMAKQSEIVKKLVTVFIFILIELYIRI